MPQELKSIDQINDALLDRTVEVRVKRAGEKVKVKFRTLSRLYTIKVDPAQAREIEARAKSKGINVVPF